MTFLRSLAFNLLFVFGGGLLLILAIPGLVMPRRASLWLSRIWHSYVIAALRVTCGIAGEVRGLENLPEAPCLVACKHQSAWETIMLPIVLYDASFVLKRELLRIPVYGWYLSRLGQVPIDRAGGAKALRRMVETAQRHLAQGRCVVIFPEGTRTAPGQRHPYHPGVAALYLQLGVPVVPVALNSGLRWRRNAFLKRPGRIVMEFLPPIPPGLPRKTFVRELEDEIESGTDRLCAAASD